MSFNDPIADFLTRIRNAQNAQRKYVDIMLSKMKINIANILKEHGFIENFIQNEKNRKMRIFLKYTSKRKGIIRQLKRVSKPGRRIYKPVDSLPRVLGGIGIALLSTSKGVIDDREARKLKVGGEVICYIW
ncbi:MAG: 30S ribosomal protein S8 [Candidatus Anoxychlamydiales bacterium]|nr:30S ribosomal protein S8 [Candidatus Anoxychlamydiales bacterium]